MRNPTQPLTNPTVIKNKTGTELYQEGSSYASNQPSDTVFMEGDEVSVRNLCHDFIKGVDFIDADLRDVCLLNTTFAYVDFTGADFTGAILGETTFICYRNLSSAVGLDTVEFHGAITLDKRTLDLNADRLPEAFLAGCGYTSDQIAVVRTLYQNVPIDDPETAFYY